VCSVTKGSLEEETRRERKVPRAQYLIIIFNDEKITRRHRILILGSALGGGGKNFKSEN
jgi:hypothetical protein